MVQRVDEGQQCHRATGSHHYRDRDIAQYVPIKCFPHISVPEKEEGGKNSKRRAIRPLRASGKTAECITFVRCDIVAFRSAKGRSFAEPAATTGKPRCSHAGG